MWFVVILLTAVSGAPIGEALVVPPYDTKEECIDAAPAVAVNSAYELSKQDAIVGGVGCISYDDLPASVKAQIDAHKS